MESISSIEERAFLVGVTLRGSRPLLSVEESLDELGLLAQTAGMDVVGQMTQTLNAINPATFIGSGKVAEVIEDIDYTGANVVIFDDELSPRHQRELEKRLGNDVKVLDRSALILDVFAQHANTREGALQVELAQYEYRLPRLTRQWTHLARQAGGGGSRSGNAGVGLRGPGETQLEVDRREIGRKIAKLKRDLEHVRTHRQQHRAQRNRSGIPVVALVGYTNVGKSTLINKLTGADVYTANQFFATLDPITRKIVLPSGKSVLVTDTVGFIQKLPTTLIAAFRATLEEITEASILLHVVDTSHSHVVQHIDAAEDVLAEIDVPRIPKILVWNKTDLVTQDERPHIGDAGSQFWTQISISAQTGAGIDQLLDAIEQCVLHQTMTTNFLIPYNRGELVSLLFEQAIVNSQIHTSEGVCINAKVPIDLYDRLRIYQQDD